MQQYQQSDGADAEDIAGGLITFPPDPVSQYPIFCSEWRLNVIQCLTARERLAAHAEVIALQKQLGISYKDASHRLYMAEVERLKVIDAECKAWANMAENLTTSLREVDENPDMEEDLELGPNRNEATTETE